MSYFLNITGYKIKKGWSVNLDVVSIHHDPEVFPNPQKFDPSRFDVTSSFPIHQSAVHFYSFHFCAQKYFLLQMQEPIKPYSFLGFGSGPRMCPRINLAKLEISIFIHHLVCRYK